MSDDRIHCDSCGVLHRPGADNALCPVILIAMVDRDQRPATEARAWSWLVSLAAEVRRLREIEQSAAAKLRSVEAKAAKMRRCLDGLDCQGGLDSFFETHAPDCQHSRCEDCVCNLALLDSVRAEVLEVADWLEAIKARVERA